MHKCIRSSCALTAVPNHITQVKVEPYWVGAVLSLLYLLQKCVFYFIFLNPIITAASASPADFSAWALQNQSGNLSVLLKCLFANQQSFQQQFKKMINLNWVERGRYHSPFAISGCNLLYQKFAEMRLSLWYHISDLVLLSVLVELGVQQENKADNIFLFISWNKIMRSLFCVVLVACCVNT